MLVAFITISNSGNSPHLIIVKSLNIFFISSALDSVLLHNKTFEAFILIRAKMIEGTTPPAPIIKIFLLATS